jgi:thiamine-phosphate pyrophosphorylase
MQMRPVLCYITDRKAFSGDESGRDGALLDKIAEAARAGIDFVQLREKDFSGRELENLAHAALQAIHRNTPPCGRSRTRLLINSRADVALAIGADGVHLPADDLPPAEVRGIWEHAGRHGRPVISVSCHSLVEVQNAAHAGVDYALFAPVFEKKDAPGVPAAGLERLRAACRAAVPVLALGGVTAANAHACLEAGAAGIAGIRMFQENPVANLLRELGA